MERKTAAKKASQTRNAKMTTASITAGVAGLLLAAWLIYGTVSIDPFLWGIFTEEMIAALCALFALRLLCFLRFPKWITIASVAVLPAVIALYGALSLPEDIAGFLRALCLASAVLFALMAATELDNKPDGVLLSAVFAAVCMPVLLSAQTRLIDEMMRALVMGGIYLSVLALRRKSTGIAALASVPVALAGAAGFYAAFAGLGTGIGLLLLAPKRKRSGWVLAAVLLVALPVAVRLFAGALLPESNMIFAQNTAVAGAFTELVKTHLLRALALGLLLISIRFFIRREDAAIPLVLALAGCAVFRLLFFAIAPDVWMDALPLCVLAGVGVAKTAR